MLSSEVSHEVTSICDHSSISCRSALTAVETSDGDVFKTLSFQVDGYRGFAPVCLFPYPGAQGLIRLVISAGFFIPLLHITPAHEQNFVFCIHSYSLCYFITFLYILVMITFRSSLIFPYPCVR